MTRERTRTGFRGALEHRDYRLLLGSMVVSSTGDWLYNVALIVLVLERTGSPSWVAILTVCKLAPFALLGPYGGALADRYDRRRLMIISDLARVCLMVFLAFVALLGAPVALVLLVVASSSAAATLYLPAVGALTPTLVGENDLAAANALTGVVDNLAIAFGPALGTLVLLVGGSPELAFVANAFTFLVSGGLVWRIQPKGTLSTTDVSESLAHRLTAGFRAIRSSGDLVLVVFLSVAFTFTFGQALVLYPLVADQRLGWGVEGFGFLLAASGVGGLFGIGLSRRLAGSRRPAAVLVLSQLVSTAPMIVMATTTNASVVIAILVAEGTAVIVADVITTTTIQRLAPPEVVGRVFGIMTTVYVGGILLGSGMAWLTVSGLGLRGALICGGAFLALCTLPALPRARSLDRVAAAKAEELGGRVRFLDGLRIFDGASVQALESLASSLKVYPIRDGDSVIREGEAADAFYAIESGTLRVTAAGTLVNSLAVGDYFGEIGVLERAPRTANVQATSDCVLYRIDADRFVEALGLAPVGARSLANTMSSRLARTHPSRRISFTPADADE